MVLQATPIVPEHWSDAISFNYRVVRRCTWHTSSDEKSYGWKLAKYTTVFVYQALRVDFHHKSQTTNDLRYSLLLTELGTVNLLPVRLEGVQVLPLWYC